MTIDRITTYHEAVHAVAAIFRYVPFERVTVQLDHESLGRSLLTEWTPDATTLDELVSRTVV